MEHRDKYLVTWMGFLILLLLGEVCIRTYNLYYYLPSIDIVSHFIAGLWLGCFFYWLVYYWHISKRLTSFFVLLGTLISTLAWEGIETLQELVIYNPPHLVDIFWWDGFFDVIVALISASILLFVVYRLEGARCEEVMYY